MVYAALALLYLKTLHVAPITLDDRSLLREFGEQSFASIWSHDRFGHLRPIKNLFFWCLARHPGSIALFRFAILACHLVAVAVTQSIASRLLASSAWGLATAICFASNPTVASVVCWLSAGNLAFCLLGLLVFALFADRAMGRGGTRPRHRDVAFALAALAFAGLSHEIAVVAPALLLLRFREIRNLRTYALAGGAFACVILLLGLRACGPAPSASYRFATYSDGLLILSAGRYLLRNLSLWLWLPGQFGVLLGDDPQQHLLSSCLCWCVVVGIGIAAWRVRRRDETLALAALWAALFFAPVINLVPFGNTPVAMHYVYLPSVGLALAAARTAQRVFTRLRARSANTAAWSCAVALGGLLGVWFVLERDCIRTWSDELQLYSRTAHNYPTNVETRLNLASAFVDRGQPDEATRVLDETLKLAPTSPTVVRAYFDMLSDIKPPNELLIFADRHAADLKTPELLYKRGQLLARVQRDEDALVFLREAFAEASDPNLRRSIGYRLVIGLVHMHHTAEAMALIDRLLAEYPDHRELLDAKRALRSPEP